MRLHGGRTPQCTKQVTADVTQLWTTGPLPVPHDSERTAVAAGIAQPCRKGGSLLVNLSVMGPQYAKTPGPTTASMGEHVQSRAITLIAV